MGLFASPSVLDVGYAQEGAFMSINAMHLTVRPVTRLAGSSARITSKGGAQGARPSRPAGDRGRYARTETAANTLLR